MIVGDLVCYVHNPLTQIGLIVAIDNSERWNCHVLWSHIDLLRGSWYSSAELTLLAGRSDE